MKYYLTLFLIFILSITTFCSNPASAYSNLHQIGIKTDTVGMEGVATVKLDYSLETEVKHDDNTINGKPQNWNLKMKQGRISLELDIAGQHYPVSHDFELGKRVDIHVAPGVDVNLFATASSPIIVNGSGHASKNTIEWTSGDAQEFTLFISENAIDGEKIEVRLPVKININLGISIDLLVFKKEITNFQIGSFDASPEIIETVQVTGEKSDQFIPIVIVAGVGLGIIVTAFVLKRQRMGTKTKSQGFIP